MKNLDSFFHSGGKRPAPGTWKYFIVTLVCAFLTPAMLSAAPDPHKTMITLPKRTVSVSEFMTQVEARSGFVFVYDEHSLDIGREITPSGATRSVYDYVGEALAGTETGYEFVDKYILIRPKDQLDTSPPVGTDLKGKVLDDSGQPVAGATVVIVGSTRGTSTDAGGNFNIQLLPNSKLINVSFVGMKDRPTLLNDSSRNLTITLGTEYSNIDEVVVIGYGVQRKKDVTGAITSITSEDMDSNVGGDINSALQGKIPGMMIVANSGEPGAGSTITIRGAASMSGSNEPLYIVDGVPFETGNIISVNEDASFSPLSTINPSDIESIEVLRDAASAAIYGSRAANGVVLITTKGGNELKPVKPVVNISHTSSIVSVSRKMDVMNSEQFREAYVDARYNNGQSATNAWVVNPTHPYYLQSTDWQDVIFRTAYQHKNDATIRGSTEAFAYSISLGLRDVKPVVVGTSYKQYSARANFTYKITKMITAGTNISYSNIDYDRILSGSGFNAALAAALYTNPCFTPYDPVTGEMVRMLGQREARNPLALALEFPINFKRRTVTLNQHVTFNLMKGLVLKLNVSTDVDRIVQSSFSSRDFDGAATVAARKDIGLFKQDDMNNFMNENTLSFNRKFGHHSLSAVLGQSIQTNRAESIILNGQNYVDEHVKEIQYASMMTRVERVISERAMLSFFGRVNYNYKSRYLASVTFRRDGSSRFGPDSRFGNFPSASVGWRFSDEPFLAFAKKFLYDGKIRASYGKTGNHSIGNYTWMGSYASASKKYNGNVAITNDVLPNNNLKWETTEQVNVGMDLSVLNGRITLNADAYVKRSKDLLFNFRIPGYTGFNSIMLNFGEIENKGLEFLVSTVNLKGAFKWNSNFNISFNRNKVVKLPQGTDVVVGTYSLAREGEPAGIFYGHYSLGIYSRTEENMWRGPDGSVRPVAKGSSNGEAFKGGDMIWKDLDDNGIIDDYDRMVIGNPHPDFIGGFGNTFSYKNLRLNVFFQFSYGGEIMNDLRRNRNRMLTVNNLGKDALNRWRNEGDDTGFPMIRYGDAMENFRPSNYTIEDGSFLRLKDIKLSYRVPAKFAKRMRMSNIDIYAAGSNLLTWSTYSGFDPEVNTSNNPFVFGVDNGAFPKNRSFNFGINVTF